MTMGVTALINLLGLRLARRVLSFVTGKGGNLDTCNLPCGELGPNLGNLAVERIAR